MRYWIRNLRPAWLVGAALTAALVGLLLALAGSSDSVPNTINAARAVGAVLCIAVAAGFADPAAAVLDGTPFRRWRRRLTPPALTLGAVTAVGSALAAVQATRVPGVPWPAIALQWLGLAMVSAAVGAVCRGRVEPGLVAPFVVVGLLTFDARAPWDPILTAPPQARVHVAWSAVILIAGASVAAGLADPGRRRRFRVMTPRGRAAGSPMTRSDRPTISPGPARPATGPGSSHRAARCPPGTSPAGR